MRKPKFKCSKICVLFLIAATLAGAVALAGVVDVVAAQGPKEELVAELPVRVRVLGRDAPHGGHAVEECALPRELYLGVELGERREPVHLLLVVHLEEGGNIFKDYSR